MPNVLAHAAGADETWKGYSMSIRIPRSGYSTVAQGCSIASSASIFATLGSSARLHTHRPVATRPSELRCIRRNIAEAESNHGLISASAWPRLKSMVRSVSPLGLFLGQPRPRLYDAMVEAFRVRHYSRRTEEAYVAWVRRFIVFHEHRHPRDRAEA